MVKVCLTVLVACITLKHRKRALWLQHKKCIRSMKFLPRQMVVEEKPVIILFS